MCPIDEESMIQSFALSHVHYCDRLFPQLIPQPSTAQEHTESDSFYKAVLVRSLNTKRKRTNRLYTANAPDLSQYELLAPSYWTES